MLDILLYDGFGDHAADGERYAADLEAAAQDEVPAKHLAQFAKVAVHTIGEHLGDWPRAAKLVDRVLAGRTPAAETAKAWVTSMSRGCWPVTARGRRRPRSRSVAASAPSSARRSSR